MSGILVVLMISLLGDVRAERGAIYSTLCQSLENKIKAYDQRIPIEVVACIKPPQSSECGLYSMAAVFASINCAFEKESLFARDNIDNGVFGTSANKLVAITKSCGLHAEIVERMSAWGLQAWNRPGLLLLDEVEQPIRHGHWVAFLGMHHDKFVLLDMASPARMVEISSGELQLRWQGLAVMIDEKPTAVFSNQAWVRLVHFLKLFELTIVSLMFWCGLKLARLNIGSTRVLGGAVALLTLGYLVTSGVCDPNGILANRATAKWLGTSYFGTNPLELPAGSIARFMNENAEIVLIDARTQYDFEAKQIPGSINISPFITQDAFDWHAQSLPRDRPVIVYCSNSGCKYAEFVAKQLQFSLNCPVYVYSPGIESLFNELIVTEWGLHQSTDSQ